MLRFPLEVAFGLWLTLLPLHAMRMSAEKGGASSEPAIAAEIAAELREAAAKAMKGEIAGTPFPGCGHEFKELPDLASESLTLKTLGKLAKGGSFLTTEDGGVLVKAVDSHEAEMLTEWAKVPLDETYEGGCAGFASTRLVPVHLTFESQENGKPYQVMENETARLLKLTGPSWRVAAVYDVKPLPNLSKGLAQWLKALLHGWGEGLPAMRTWNGWDEVRELLRHDLNFLQRFNIVDFSLFAHVIFSEGGEGPLPSGLGPQQGCIQMPGGKALVCFSIIDYLTEYSWIRVGESIMKGNKFGDYTGKFLQTFDCIGDLADESCQTFRDLNKVLEASKESKAHSKAAFLGTQIFEDSYECKSKVPTLEYEVKWLRGWTGTTTRDTPPFAPHFTISKVTRIGKMQLEHDYDDGNHLAPELRSAADPAQGAAIVGKDFLGEMEVAHGKMRERFFQNGSLALQNTGDAQVPLCAQAVREFATEDYSNVVNEDSDLGNVLYSPESESIVVVRGAPSALGGILNRYKSHAGAVERARAKPCFLKTKFYRCRPRDGEKVYFDYHNRFGKLEIMVMSTREFSGKDFDIFVEALERGSPVGDPLTTVLNA